MVVISVDNISKTYFIGGREPQSVLKNILTLGGTSEQSVALHVLKDVSLKLEQGEVLGIVGKNGCGKSTLLRIIANILTPNTGTVTSTGRLVPLIHLDTGVKARLTMSENIFLAGTLLGMTKKQIETQHDSIVRYAGLESFVHTKWYKFSDGMKQKVVFSVGVHSNPDILLLDEAFSAGDEQFKRKSLATIAAMVKAGTSVLMVGHNLATMEQICNRVIWIADGSIKQEGLPEEVIHEYRTYAQ